MPLFIEEGFYLCGNNIGNKLLSLMYGFVLSHDISCVCLAI